MTKFATFGDYVASLPTELQSIATSVGQIISEVLPAATCTIKYNIPAFNVAGKTIIYFAVWKKHTGLYPIYKGTDDFEREISAFRAKKDTVQFLNNKPIPKDVIVKIVQSQLAKLGPKNG